MKAMAAITADAKAYLAEASRPAGKRNEARRTDAESVAAALDGKSVVIEFIGPIAVENLKHFQIETCFIGTASFSERGIFSSQNIIEAQLKAEVLKISKRRIILADHTKYNSSGFCVFARPGEFDVLITDDGFQDAGRFQKLGIEVLRAERKET